MGPAVAPMPLPASRAAPLLLPAAAALVTAAALASVLADRPAPDEWARLTLLALLAVVGGLHRPAGIGLGAGAATLPLAAALHGWALTALLAAIAAGALALEGAQGGLRARRRAVRRLLPHLALHALAGAAAGAAWEAAAPPWRPVAAAAAWLLLLAGLPLLQQRLAVAHGDAADAGPDAGAVTDGSHLRGLPLDALGWTGGALLVPLAAVQGFAAAALLLAVLATLAAEAGRQRRLSLRAEQERAAFERIGRAGERLATSSSRTEEVALRIHRESRQVLPFSWFYLRLAEGDEHWHAGPDSRLRPGPPEPPSHPPPLPGVHRRASWLRLERPLTGAGAELARLTVWCDPRRVAAETETLFDQLVPQLSALLYRATLHRQANEDPLTGVALRRVLDAALQDELGRSRETGEPLSVVLLDLDFFKRVNDRFGHATGDRALVAVAEVLRRHLRDGDLCARYGGEEFTLLFPGLGGHSVLAIVERLRAQVEELSLEAEGEPVPLSISAGVACFPEVHCRTPEELLELADGALYEAKRLGRNCCLLHLGRGRFLDGRGREVETEQAGAGPQPPKIFA